MLIQCEASLDALDAICAITLLAKNAHDYDQSWKLDLIPGDLLANVPDAA